METLYLFKMRIFRHNDIYVEHIGLQMITRLKKKSIDFCKYK